MAHLVMFNHEGRRLIPISHIENQVWWLMPEIPELKRQAGESIGRWVGHQAYPVWWVQVPVRDCALKWGAGLQRNKTWLWSLASTCLCAHMLMHCSQAMDIHAHTHRYTYKVHIRQTSIKVDSTVFYKASRKNDWRIESRRQLHLVCFLRFHLRQWKKKSQSPLPSLLLQCWSYEYLNHTSQSYFVLFSKTQRSPLMSETF